MEVDKKNNVLSLAKEKSKCPTCKKISKEPFFAFVRYLNAGINYNFSKMQNLLLTRGLAKKAPLGLGSVWAVSARDVFDLGIEQLKKDPFFFLDQTPTRQPWKK